MKHRKVRAATEHDGQVLWITLDAPPGNILDLEMIDGLRALLANEGRGPDVKALVFEGASDEFSYGASVREHRPGEVEKTLPRFHDLFRDLLEVARPTVAVVNGRCLGGGLELAAFCNWVFASPDATFGLPEVRLALFPPLGSLILPPRVGRSMAEALCITGRTLDAEEALDANLIDGVAEDPADAARAWIESSLLPHSAIALHYATRAAQESMREPFLHGLGALEKLYLGELMRTEDAREGIAAFLDKRPPRWKNR
ncbi:MAG: enoyl-CoA hydratase/isomerase family protein [Candidatus Krumholzibacteriia bacterium]